MTALDARGVTREAVRAYNAALPPLLDEARARGLSDAVTYELVEFLRRACLQSIPVPLVCVPPTTTTPTDRRR